MRDSRPNGPEFPEPPDWQADMPAWPDAEAHGLDRPPAVRPGKWKIGPRDSELRRKVREAREGGRATRAQLADYELMQLPWWRRALMRPRPSRRRRARPGPWIARGLVLAAVLIALALVLGAAREVIREGGGPVLVLLLVVVVLVAFKVRPRRRRRRRW